MIPRKKLQVLLYVLRIYYVFGDGAPAKENLKFLDNSNGTELGINKLDNFNHNWTKTREETTELTFAENTIPNEIENEIRINEVDDLGKNLNDIEVTNLIDKNQTSGEKPLLEDPKDSKFNIGNVKVTNSTSDSITISWLVKSIFVPFYKIEWFHEDSSDHEYEVSNNSVHTINKLKPCTLYTIRISEGTKSVFDPLIKLKNFHNSTKPEVPEDVRNLTAEATGTSINISWIEPETSECVIEYSVAVFNSRNQSFHNVTANTTFLNLTDLNPCTEYFIEVKAVGVGEVGSSPGKNTTIATKFVKPGKPRNAGDLPIKEKSLKIFWDPPNIGASCVKEYRVTLNTEIPIGNPAQAKTKCTEDKEIVFENLFPCTTYSVQINAVDVQNGDSLPEQIDTTNPTLESETAAPKRDKVPSSTKDSVTLFWNIGNENNCTFISVDVICNATGSEGIGYDPFSGNPKTGSSNSYTIDKYHRHLVIVTVHNLDPFTSYDCQAKTIVGKSLASPGSKIVNFTTLEDVPSAPELNVTNVTDAEYTFDWIEPEYIPGTINNFEISLSWEPLYPVPDECNPIKSNATLIPGSLNEYTYKKGSPFSNYTARIRAKTGAGWGNYSEPIEFTSETGLPSGVTNLDYYHENSANNSNALRTTLKWGLPCNLNGVLEFFNITVHGTKNNSEDHNFYSIINKENEEHKDDGFSMGREDYKPAYEYTFTVSTKVKNATKLGAGTLLNIQYPAGVPVQPENDYVRKLTMDPQKAGKTTTTAAVLLPLFPETNGDIKYYAVMVSQMGFNKATSTRHDLKENDWPNASCWQESMLQDFSIPYQATSPRWNPIPNYVIDYGKIKAVKFTLGQDMDCKELSVNTDSRLYCNGPLKPGTWYHVRMRAFTSGGYTDSDVFTVKTNAELNVPMIIGVVFGIMTLGILTTLMLLVRRCSLQAVLRRFLHSDLPGSPVPTPFTRRKFISHCQQLADNTGKLSNEFQLLQTLSLDLQMPTNAACLQANRKKNRYSDILPYDFSRVKLNVIDNDPNTDYINASFITGYSGNDEYIACQGPKEETTYDFWRMVDQYDVKIIVMLTQLFEKGKEKCHQYFPVIRETFTYEKMSIRCTSELDFRTCTQRTLVLEKDNKKRSIMHLHFKDWPDHDVPEDFDPMINFCQIMRRQITANKGLVVIHCSAGIGRTGTLIAIDMLLQSIRDNRKLDVFGTVYRLRRHRLNMVQRESQYAYIYNCIRQVLKNPYFLKNYKPPPVDPLHKNSKKKKDSANSSLGLVSSLDTWRKGSLSLSADSMEPMYETSPSSTLESPKNNGLRCTKSMSALDPKNLGTCVVKSSSQGYVTYESVKNSSSGSSNMSLDVSDFQGSRRSVYENVSPLFRSKSDQLIDGIDSFMCQSNHEEPREETSEKDTSL